MDRGDPQISKSPAMLHAPWDDDNDMVLGKVADDRTKKEMVKISAVVDSGAEANVLPENMMQWIPLKPSSASKSGKIFRGARRDAIPARIVWKESTWVRTRPFVKETSRVHVQKGADGLSAQPEEVPSDKARHTKFTLESCRST